MAGKKSVKQSRPKGSGGAPAGRAARASGGARRGAARRDRPLSDPDIVIVDDDMSVDHEKVNEERRAYLDEARSQEAFD